VTSAWNILEAYGLPDGPPRPPPSSIDFDRVRAALAMIDLDVLDTAARTVLLGWLDGWRHHWPSRFAAELGELGETLHGALRARPFDRGRFVKLRRIATENLAGVL
jgi:hypothetical protein